MKHPHERYRQELVETGKEIKKTDRDRIQTENHGNATIVIEYGHIAPNCPLKETKGSNISREGNNDRDRDRNKSITSMIKNVSLMGLKVKKTEVLNDEIVGELGTANAETLEDRLQALLDTILFFLCAF